MSTINDTDQFLVQRNSSSFQTNASDLMSTIQDTDLMLIQRGAGSYKVTCEDVKDQLGGGGGGDLSLVTLAPLSGTPDFEVTAVTDLSEILPGSTINYQWYRYTGSTGGTGALLQELTSDSAILDTYTTTAADQGGYIGCTVTYLGITVTETARTQCLVAPGPVANMYGLRFDALRLTALTRSMPVPSKWTFSAWAKITSAADFDLFTQGSGARFMARGDGTYSYNGYNTPQCYSLNEWHQVVLSVDGSNLTIAVNGVVISAATASSNYTDALTYIGSGPGATPFDRGGYLSEVYFAEEVLPPTAFGKNFEPYGWGPLDSSQIIENINNAPQISPYDTRANTDEVWSDGATTGSFYPGAPPSLAFDGDLTTSCGANTSGGFTLAMDVDISSTLRIYAGGTAGLLLLTVGGAVVSPAISSSAGWVDVSNVAGKKLTLINWTTGNPSLSAVEIDGRLLVDQGVWNNSQDWSESIPNNFYYGTPEAIYNGNASNDADSNASFRANTETTVFSGSLAASSLRIYVNTSSGGVVKVNGSSATASFPGAWGWVEVTGWTGPITSVTLTDVADSSIAALEADGSILVDSGAQWNTSQIWSAGAYGVNDSSPPATALFSGDLLNQTTNNIWFSDSGGGIDFSNVTVSDSNRLVVIGTSSADNYFVRSGGVDQLIDFNAAGGVSTKVSIDCTDLFPTPWSLEALIATAPNGGISEIQLGGEVLVDKSSFGASGFYLPFDPTNTGVNYSSDITTTDGPFANGSSSFDGNTASYGSTTSNGATASFPSVAAISTGVLEIYYLTNSQGATVYFDDAEVATLPPNISQWTECGNLSGINKVSIGCAGTMDIAGFRVNGKTLIDHSSIGVDESGNENNFLDQGFVLQIPAASGSGNKTQPWANYFEQGVIDAGAAFDGDTSTYSQAAQNNGSFNWVLPAPITGSSGQVVEYILSATDTYTIAYTNKAGGSTELKSLTATPTTITTTLTDDYEGLFTTQNSGVAALRIHQVKLNGVVFLNDGSPTPGQDTVTDTPLMNYATFTSGTNGNLEYESFSTNGDRRGSTILVRDKKVYAEASPVAMSSDTNYVSFGIFVREDVSGLIGSRNDGFCYISNGEKRTSSSSQPYGETYTVGDLIGMAYDSANGTLEFFKNGISQGIAFAGITATEDYLMGAGLTQSAQASINFGQQPFAASNVTYDQATGIVEIPGTPSPYEQRANTDQVWSNGASSGFRASNLINNVFDGIDSTIAVADTPADASYTFPVSVSGALRVYASLTSANPGADELVTVTLNTGENGIIKNGDSSPAWIDFGNVTSVGSITFKSTGSTGTGLVLRKIELEGRLLVDQDVWNNSQNWSDNVSSNNGSYFSSEYLPQNAFDGNLSSEATSQTQGTSGTLTVNNLGFTGTYDVRVRVTGSNVTVNGSSKAGDYTKDWVEFTGVSDPSSIVVAGGGASHTNAAASLFAVEVSGSVLVDSGAQWDTSQVWSADVVGAVNPAGAFNGSNTEVEAASASTDIVFTPNLGAGSFDIVVTANDISSSPNNTVTIDGTALTAGAGSSSRQFTGTVSSFNEMTISSASGKANFKSVTVDNKILIDPTGGAYNTLFQTWEQTKTALLNARVEGDEVRISQLEGVLIRQAVPFERSTQYPKGTVVNMRGRLFEALVDGADVSASDFITRLFRNQEPEWENLEVRVSEEVLVD